MPENMTARFDDLMVADTPAAVTRMYEGYAKEAETADFGLLEEDIVVLDTETTGLSFKTCELIEVAAVKLRGREVVGRFERLVKPRGSIPAEITALTGISDADVFGADCAEDVVADLAEFVGGAPVVAHNATFDRGFIEKVAGGSKVSDTWIDSLALSRIALPRLKSHALGNLAQVFGCESVEHRAMADVMALAGIWRIILVGLSHLPKGFMRYLSEMHPDVSWSYRPVFGQLAGMEPDAGFDMVGVRKELVADLAKKPHTDADELVGMTVGVTRAETDEAFGPEGFVARAYDEYEPRPEQKAMSAYVAFALSTAKNLGLEAGTGVGKSMAYLVPLALYARKNGITVGVATKTNALTDQIMSHELPLLAKNIPGGLNFCGLKGYDHYPCLRKVTRWATSGSLPMEAVDHAHKSENTVAQDMLTAIAVTLANASQATEGDVDSLGIKWRNVPRGMITTTPPECERSKCPFYSDKCLLHGARKRAAAADIVVTNHALLLRDVAAEGRILPPIRNWVVDEAHSFEDEARRQWSLSVSSGETQSALEQLGGIRTGALHATVNDVSDKADATPVLALLSKANSEASRVRTLSGTFFDALDDVATAMRKRSQYDTQAIWVNVDVRMSEPWLRMVEAGLTFSDALAALVKTLGEASSLAHESIANVEIDDPLGKLERILGATRLILQGEDASYVYSLVVTANRFKAATVELVAEKIDIGAELAATWYPEMQSVTYTSATMSVAGDFKHFDHSVGFDLLDRNDYVDVHLDSSYDFDANMAALIVKDLPDPRDAGYLEALEDMLYDTHVAMGGSTLTLFTNRREMEQVYARLQPRLKAAGLDLMQQDRNANVRHIREKFIANKSVSLFALKSFWEGFDAAGDTLRCVVIPKLPFANPNEPLSQEREARDRRAWWNYALPDSVLAVKQAAGRLIRTSCDTGVLVLADSRLVTKRYGKVFIDTLPTRNVSQLQSDMVGRFITTWRKTHDVC